MIVTRLRHLLRFGSKTFCNSIEFSLIPLLGKKNLDNSKPLAYKEVFFWIQYTKKTFNPRGFVRWKIL
jgi:hypothetical protein